MVKNLFGMPRGRQYTPSVEKDGNWVSFLNDYGVLNQNICSEEIHNFILSNDCGSEVCLNNRFKLLC